jgi:hypothetical protein
MNKVPTLSGISRSFFWIIHLIFIVPPLFYFIYIIITQPHYLLSLINSNKTQPLGWIFAIIILSGLGLLILLFLDSIKKVERRPQYKSMIVTVLFFIVSFLTLFAIMFSPALYMVIQAIY